MGTETARVIAPPADSPPWSELIVGLKVGPLVHTISLEMVRDFCAAMPADAAIYERQGVMPPTLLATDYIPLLRGHLELGWGLMSRHTVKTVRHVVIGDTVTVAGEIVDKFERKGRHYWTLRYDVRNARDEVCVEYLVTCSVD
jgi:hypothetical protein